ncbi:unnamed protein product [Orchesella dallaii]|uniref:Uncharacterized protein n=1 Tax=Orchesella dallaii TaxID=48710 RepID=A0ABP1QC09_9HEXA
MSDIIYPGIVTVRADPAVSQNDLIQYLHKTIGSDSSLYQDGEPKIEIFEPTRKGRSSVTVVISGILLPLAEIRRRFGRNKLVGRYFFIQSPDFGIPREWKNQFEFQKNILHNNLKKSQGILSPIKLFQKSFTSSFGTLTTFTETIFFNDVARNVNTAALEYLPGLILYNDTMHKSSSGTYDAAVKLKYENMEIVFSNRMEALQAVCWLNDNSGFSSKRRRFLTYSGGGECGLRGVVKVGTDAQPLNIAAEMEINGYIPWEKLNRKTVWSDQQLENLDTVCFICDTHYSIKGVGPDISWLAATCKCPTEG